MSQFQPPADDFEFAPPPTTTSKLAVASLVCSLIFFCPVTTLLGPLLGIIALATMGEKRGRGLAVVGILLGVVLSVGWYWAGNFAYSKGKMFFEVVMEGPADALQAGTSGDLATFKAAFHGGGATATDTEAQAFLDALTTRYGAYQSCRFDESSPPPQPTPGQVQTPFPYILSFSNNANVSSEAEIIWADQTTGKFLLKLTYIEVYDPDLGDLRYPALSAGP